MNRMPIIGMPSVASQSNTENARLPSPTIPGSQSRRAQLKSLIPPIAWRKSGFRRCAVKNSRNFLLEDRHGCPAVREYSARGDNEDAQRRRTSSHRDSLLRWPRVHDRSSAAVAPVFVRSNPGLPREGGMSLELLRG